MTVREFYKNIREDYDKVLALYRDENRIAKFLKIYAQDDTFEQLVKFLEIKDYAEAFRMAHTLKGITANLCFSRYYKEAYLLTEVLRKKEYSEDILPSFMEVKRIHDLIQTNLNIFNDENTNN